MCGEQGTSRRWAVLAVTPLRLVLRRPAFLCITLFVALAWAGTSWGHGDDAVEGFRSTVSGIRPAVPGLLVRVLEGDTLSVRNWSGKSVIVTGPDDDPLFRFERNAVYRRNGEAWRLVKRGSSHAWHDRRVHMAGPAPLRSGFVSRFAIGGTADGAPFVIAGFIGYRAPATEEREAGLPAWAVVSVVVLGAVLLAALALPLLVRREGESSDEKMPTTEGSPDSS